MKPDTKLVLGDFAFSSLEIPAEIPFGGSQSLAVHRLVGGVKVIDAMGRDDRPLQWGGLLLGPTAVTRALFLDSLRTGGKPQQLTWAQFRYSVLVREFDATYQRAFQIPYRITCEVVADLTNPVTQPGAAPVDQAISDDSKAASTLVDGIDDGPLSGLMAGLNTAIAAVSSFAHAAQSTINTVLQPLAAVQARVQVLIASTGNTIGNVTTFGGVLPGNPLAVAAAKLTSQVTATTQSASLYNLRNVLGRMGANLGAINTPQASVATAGGNLFSIAEQQYGDAMAWTGIAKANGLTDPFVQGAQTLKIPPQPDQAGGVLTA